MANEPIVRLTRSVALGGQTIGGTDESLAANYQAVYRETITAGSVNHEVDFPVTVANSLVQAIHATADLTLLTNSTGSPAQTITAPKNVILCWSNNEPVGKKILTADVTKFYVSNAGAADAILTIGIAADQTP